LPFLLFILMINFYSRLFAFVLLLDVLQFIDNFLLICVRVLEVLHEIVEIIFHLLIVLE